MIELEWYHLLIAVFGGFLAGCINTIAGSGSVITLGILIELLGLPGNIANGTNRVGILFQGIAGVIGFKNNNKLNLSRSRTIIISTLVGAVVGAIIAINITNAQFKFVFKILMVCMLIVILVRPKKWLQSTDLDFKLSPFLAVPVFFILGIYGGFIQMGMGVFFLAAMVLLAKYDIIESNAIKLVIVTIYTVALVALFQWQEMIDWKAGLLIAIGQAGGGYITAHYASRYEQANLWAYRTLVVIVVAVLLKTFGFFSLF